MKTIKQLILEALLFTQHTQVGGRGICYSVDYCLHDTAKDEHYYVITLDCFEEFMDFLKVRWEHYSGSKTFPVPHTNETVSLAFENACRSKALWQGEYGNKRKQLLQFLIDNIDAMNDDGSINNQYVIKQENK